jgi:hypothetical protein
LFACSQGPKSGSAEITVSWTFTTALGYHHFIRRTTVSRQCLFCKLYSFVPRVSSAVPMTRDFPMGVCDAPNQILMTSEKSSIQPLLDSLYIHSWNSREYYLLPAGSARLSLVSVPWAGRLQPPPLGIIIPFVESIAPDSFTETCQLYHFFGKLHSSFPCVSPDKCPCRRAFRLLLFCRGSVLILVHQERRVEHDGLFLEREASTLFFV